MRRTILLAVITLTAILPLCAQGNKSYRERYADVIAHYSLKAADSLRLKAALFLIDNMEGHSSPEGQPIDYFCQEIRNIDTSKGIRELNLLWAAAARTGKVEMKPDSSVVTCRMLISNIDAAFDAWEGASWHGEVSFQGFCRYILPYRCSDEHIGGNWRKAFHEKYSHLLNGVRDVCTAFYVVRNAVMKDVVLSNDYCPYTVDPITCASIGRAECGQRCVTLTCALRALGIPAVIDTTPMWADYSSKGHAWVALALGEGKTLTVNEGDSMARQYNPVDASVFENRYEIKPEDNCPYSVKRTKTPIKIYRQQYHLSNPDAGNEPWFLSAPFIEDVSGDYALRDSVTFDAPSGKMVYLCAYMSAQDWMPVARAVARDGRVCFRNVGSDLVCLPVTFEDNKRKVLSFPVLIKDNKKVKTFKPSLTGRQRIRIERKYPLCSYTTDVWGGLIGGVFEGADTRDFTGADTLAVIGRMPHGLTRYDVCPAKEHRFLRFRCTTVLPSSVAELRFYSGEVLLEGTCFYDGMDAKTAGRLFDGNVATYCRATSPDYYAGIDLGEGNESMVTGIGFSPGTDLNFVERGHLYELYYYDTNWHLIGRRNGGDGFLEFENVPEGCLLLLKDRTAGREERIFEYTDGIQVWY